MDLTALNLEQRMAAETLRGPVLVLAGAGSGKTRALTYRAANLIANGVEARRILALTFTNKAAGQMRKRIEALVGVQSNEAWISTFHSACARILRRDIDKLGYTSAFAIYDDDDQASVIKDILKRLDIDDKFLPPYEIRAKISDMKSKLMNEDEYFTLCGRDYRAQRLHDVMTEYERRLKAANALDFDDLINKTLELFADHPPVLKSYQNRFTYVLVDEYQDTNAAQYMLVRLITRESRNLCVVGDDDQSIYGWRGADIQNILGFEKDYPEAQVVRLEQNYRSTANILDAANHVIAHNAGRKDKTLWTEKGNGEPIKLFLAGDEREEAAWVCDQIRKLSKTGSLYGDTAVLYRMNAQSRVIEEMLIRAGIPYRVFGGLRFYDRREIRDVIAYLRVIVNPCDDVSLRRIINEPKRAIGDATVSELADYARHNDIPLFGALYNIPETLSSRPKKCVAEFAGMMNNLLASKETMRPAQFINHIMEATGLLAQYRGKDTDESRAREENMMELLSAAADYEKSIPEATLEGFLENVALVTEWDQSADSKDFVTLMTLHSAKGLEFNNVFITGLEEGVFPSARCVEDENRLEEERRLCYVGITRARKRLYISHSFKRMLHNQLSHNPPSRFLEEIPKRLIKDEFIIQRSSLGLNTPREANAPKRREQMGFMPMGVSRAIRNDPFAPFGIPGVHKGFVPSKARAEVSDAAQNLFAAGDHVLHKKFGEGNVVEVTGNGDNARIRIAFTAYGEKEFALAIAPIVKVGE